MEQTTNFSHTGSIGDCHASIPAMREHYRKTGKKINLYLTAGIKAEYYDGAVHPTKNENGEQVMLNEAMIKMMIPLYKEQEFINDCKLDEGEKIDIDLGLIRDTFVNMPYGDLRKWYFYIYPDLACDLSKQYIFVPDLDTDIAKGKIVVARSERYRNDRIDYSFLKPYEDDLVFSGTMREYNNFCMQFDLNIRKLNITDFLQLAQILKQSRGLIANQTMITQIAEGLKIPRIVELCSFAPNVYLVGENAYEFYAQQGLEYYFHVLNGTVDKYFETLKAAQVNEQLLKKDNG